MYDPNSQILGLAQELTNRSCRNGTLQEYIVPEVSKDDFRTRLSAAVNGQKSPGSTQESQSGPAAASNDTAAASTASGPTPAAASTPSQPRTTPSASGSTRPSQSAPQEKSRVTTPAATKESPKKPAPSKPQPAKEVKKENLSPRPEKKQPTPKKATVSADKESEPKKPAPRGPPSQYRLQVRLFDGSSVRSSFSPTQTITKDVRPWLDGQMGDEKRPYHLKHILTPLPNRTLSVADESQTLQNLGLGSTANLVMIPVQAYTEAYASAGSLPARGASAIYNLVSSIVSTAVGFVGSLIGYGPSAPTSETDSSAPAPAESSRQPRPTGPNIRTLRDQENDRGNSQLYNGNQVGHPDRYNLGSKLTSLPAQFRAQGPGSQRQVRLFKGKSVWAPIIILIPRRLRILHEFSTVL